MPRKKITPRLVQSASCPPDRARITIADSQTHGLVLEVRASGGKTFYVRYRDARGSQRNIKIGNASSISLDAARRKTVESLSRYALGEDPAQAKSDLKSIPLFEEFVVERYLPFIKGYKRSWQCDDSLLRNHILPRWGRRPLNAIKHQDVIALHHGMRESGMAAGTANRALVLTRYMFNLAVRWKIGGIRENPTAGVDLFKLNNQRQVFLDKDEIKRLLEAAHASDNSVLINIIRFLLMTGARKMEVQRAEWRHIDLRHNLWIIPDTKAGIARQVPLSDVALELLAAIPSAASSPYIFPNPRTGKPYVSIFHAWDRVRKDAGLPELRIHDLRHSFASMLVNEGRSLYVVQKLLGHAHIRTTERYAHLSNEALSAAVNATTRYFSDDADDDAPTS